MLAQISNATNAEIGLWIMIAFGLLQGISILVGLLGYFATKSEVKKMDERITALELDARNRPERMAEMQRQLDRSSEARISGVHNRLNPMENATAHLEGEMQAFNLGFDKFTRIIEATSHASNDTLTAFTRALDTFANVVDRNSREQRKA